MHRPAFTERDLRSLRVFCAAAEAGGFGAAESRLNMSKASISRHIRDVEARLGVRLCERGPRGFRLTAAGAVAVDLAATALSYLERIRPEIDAVHGMLSGTLVIGMVEHLVTDRACRIAEAVAELARRAPNVQTQVSVMAFPTLNQALRERRVDIAIRGMYAQDPLFRHQALFVETHRIYRLRAPGAQRRARLPLVYRPHPFVEQAISEHGFERGPDAGGLEAIGLLVATGHYAGILPERYARLVAQHYRLELIPKSPAYHNTICAITELSRPLTRRAELFLEILGEVHARSPSGAER